MYPKTKFRVPDEELQMSLLHSFLFFFLVCSIPVLLVVLVSHSDKNNKSNAMEMFNTLRTSSTTRFQNYGKGFVISFTRYKNDPILKLIDICSFCSNGVQMV